MTLKQRPRLKHIRLRTIKAPYGFQNKETTKRHQEDRQGRSFTTQSRQEARQNYRPCEKENEREVLDIDHILNRDLSWLPILNRG